MPKNDSAFSQYLLIAGTALFLAGLVSGLAIGAMSNPRLGLSAHLEAVMNGTVLIAIGLAWNRLALSSVWERVAFWTLLYGSFANWVTVQLAAWWGAGRLTPIAAQGMTAADWQENVVGFGLASLTLAMILSFSILLIGFWRGR